MSTQQTMLRAPLGVAAKRWLISNAKQHFVAREYRVAAVEVVSALEVGLSGFVEKCIRPREAHGRFKHVRPGPMVLLEGLLPPAATVRQWKLCQPLIDDCAEVVATRHGVIHKGVRPSASDIEKIKKGIVAAEALLDVLSGGNVA